MFTLLPVISFLYKTLPSNGKYTFFNALAKIKKFHLFLCWQLQRPDKTNESQML